jgi:hypothetical protein
MLLAKLLRSRLNHNSPVSRSGIIRYAGARVLRASKSLRLGFRFAPGFVAVNTARLLLTFSMVCPGSLFAEPADANDPLQAGFVHPPASARPWVNWFWLDGNVTRAGITADLEAMQRVGIGGALLMDVSQDIPPGPVKFGSQEWFDLVAHTFQEARRLGLEINLHNAPGWSGSGGPWITPALSMQKLVWTRTNLFGPARFESPLPRLPAMFDYSRDIAVLAFPTLAGDGAPLPGFNPKWSANFNPAFSGAALLDGDPSTTVPLPPPAPARPVWIQLEFTNAFAASHLTLLGTPSNQRFSGVLQVSDDGRKFRDVRPFSNRGYNVNLEFEEISARWFRILFNSAGPATSQLLFSELDLGRDYRIPSYQIKSGLGQNPDPLPYPAPPPKAAMIASGSIVDLTEKVDAQGRLVWDVPPGRWTILRLSHTPVGTENHPVQSEARGLECDKLSREAMDAHFAAFIGRLAPASNSIPASAFTQTHIDSWEVGYQNWTPQFMEEFTRRRGYDPLLFLPALTGRIVQSPEISERFLWDVRRTVAGLVADNYAGRLAELAHERGMKLSIEAYGLGPFDDLQLGARADIPMGEFWADPNAREGFDSCRAMASSAHLHARPIVAAEAFTSYPSTAKWLNHPYSLKPLADQAFCAGVNCLVFHRFAHQPWLDRSPGMTMGPFGIHYERTETWWDKSQPWHEYLARCQLLLQQGHYAADICQLTDEGAFCKSPSLDRSESSVPPGFAGDLGDPEAVLSLMSVRDGRLVLPDGMSYRMLVLSSNQRMSPALLRKIRHLVSQGAIVLGLPPTNSPSLSNYPQCDAEVTALANEIWGDCDGVKNHKHRFGTGWVFAGIPARAVLEEFRLPPDFQALDPSTAPGLHFIHRIVSGTDLYFVANSLQRAVSCSCSFRVGGRQPELWHPDTGQIEYLAVWKENAASTSVPLNLDPAGSVFVVFRRPSAGLDSIVSIQRDGKPSPNPTLSFYSPGHFTLKPTEPGIYTLTTISRKTIQCVANTLPKPLVLSGPWEITVPPNLGAPAKFTLPKLESWSENRDAGIKYFSGTATYHKTFHLPNEFLRTNTPNPAGASAQVVSRRIRILLDLGRVEVIAGLKLNGADLGTLWKPPFTADISDALVAGDNTLEIQVVNLWPNRLIGDEQLPEDCHWGPVRSEQGSPLADWPQWLLDGKPGPTGRITFSTWKHWTKNSPLLTSGLLGPVTIRSVESIQLSN